MSVCVEIFSQGEELLIGQTVDTNAAWLSERLVALGFKVTRHSTVGDCLDDLVQLLKEIAARADCCICTGGLGPTGDDLTAEAVALAFDLPLEFDPIAYAQISAFFECRNRIMPVSNRKQALLPEGSMRIDNAWGTAPGFVVQQGRCRFVFLPGVPSEMKHLFNDTIKPLLMQNYTVQPSQRVTLKTIGIGESAIQEKIASIALPESVQLGFRTGEEENQTKLVFPYAYPQAEKISLIKQFEAALGDYVFSIEGLDQTSGDLVDELGKILQARQQTLSVLETLSQGLIAAKCVGRPWLLQSAYRKNWQGFLNDFGLPQDNLAFPTIAEQLAKLERRRSGAHFALVQLYDGNSAELHDKDQPVTLYNALATEQATHLQIISVAGTVRRKQNQAALMALDLLRRFLQNKSL